MYVHMYSIYIASYIHTCYFPVASSVTRIIAGPNVPDINSDKHDFTITCTIHPSSTADRCEVMVAGGSMNITSSYYNNNYVHTYVRT